MSITIEAGVADAILVPLDTEPTSAITAIFTGPGGTVSVPAQANGAGALVTLAAATTKGWAAQTGTVTITDADGAVLATADVTISRAVLDRQALVTAAVAAFTANKTYLAIPTPTTAQAVAQVKALTQQTNGIIKLVADALNLI